MPKRTTAESDSPSCSVLVVSCDRYRDLWTPFFTLFSRYWSDCDLPVYLGTNCAQVNFEHVLTLNAGHEEAWSKRLRSLLQTIGTDYVLLLLEDFFLDQTVSNSTVKSHLKLLHSLDGVSMRLFPNPPADYFKGGVGVIHNRAAFRVSLQAAIWHRSRLLQLLVDEESIWDFEACGSRRSQAWPAGFYCASEPVIRYQHVVERGEWFRPAARIYNALNVGCDFQARPVMGLLKTWKKRPANLVRRFANKLRSYWLCIRYPETASDAS